MTTGSRPKRILLTFARSFITLEIARHMHAQGHTIFAADSLPVSVTRFSKAVSKCYLTPSPRFEPKAYIKNLVDIVKKENIDWLIPVYEEISYISKSIHAFPSSCQVFCPTFEQYDSLQNKWSFQEQLKSLGIATLDSALLATPGELAAFQCTEDYALKPCYSRASLMLRKVRPGDRLTDVPIIPHNPWIAQKWVNGNKYCTYTICHQGKIYAHSTYPVSYAIDGNSCVIFSNTRHQGIHHWVADFVKKLNFSGQIAFDFIETPEKKLFAIECNPRSTNGILLFGVNDRLDKAFLGTSESPILPKEGSRQQIAVGMLLYGWRKSATQDHSLSDFLKTFFTTKDVIFRFNDPKPFLFEPVVFAYLMHQCYKSGLSLPAFFTHDHDWNGEPLEAFNP